MSTPHNAPAAQDYLAQQMPLKPQLPTYDMWTPGEPAGYRVPAQYRRPYGDLPRDQRGRGYFLAFAAMVSAATAAASLIFAFGFYGLNTIVALAAIVMGIMGLIKNRNSPKTSYTSKTTTFAWIGIAGGALTLLATVTIIVFFVMLFSQILGECADLVSDTQAYRMCIENL